MANRSNLPGFDRRYNFEGGRSVFGSETAAPVSEVPAFQHVFDCLLARWRDGEKSPNVRLTNVMDTKQWEQFYYPLPSPQTD